MEKNSRITITHRTLALTAVSALALSGLALSGSINPAPAHAVGGEVSNSTGVLWGVDEESGLGSYQVGVTGNGNDITGFATTSFEKFPTTSDNYSDPEKLNNLTDEQRNILSVALWLDHQVSEDNGISEKVAKSLSNVSDSSTITESFLTGLDRDKVIAGIAASVQDALSKNFNVDTVPEEVRPVYDLILEVADVVEDNDENVFSIRTVDDNGKPDILSPVDSQVAVPVISATALPGDPLSPETTTTTTTITTPVTVIPTTSTTTTTKADIEIRTSAGTQARNVVEKGKTIIDTVTFTGLTPGEEYRLVGETFYKGSDGKEVSDGNKGERKFTPDTPNGRIDVSIPMNDVKAREVVVFETLYDSDNKVVAEHKDINDRAQTVGSAPINPTLKTSVQVDGGLNPTRIQSGMTVTDLVAYDGLTPGKNYRLEARLVCKDNAQEFGDTKTLHEFTPDKEAGETAVKGIEVKNTDCGTQVVFEKLYELTDSGNKGILIGTHEEIDDMAQTFGVGSTNKNTNRTTSPSVTDKANYEKKKVSTPTPSPAPSSRATAPTGSGSGDECVTTTPTPSYGMDQQQENEQALSYARGLMNNGSSGYSNSRIRELMIQRGFNDTAINYAMSNLNNSANSVSDNVTYMAQSQSVSPENSVRFEDNCDQPAERQTISDVPSGTSSAIGFTLFKR